ncbi:MAG: transposase [Candidatus Heimdallarchaeota archaeon]|nr:transposase [Candidatus Heimdallarchaeota archaeon]MCK4609530.1 transposase [Candidatus Heimdallarchaeota archaeon]
METQIAQQLQAHTPLSLTKVMRNYQVVLKCADQSQREEINRRIKTLEERQIALLTPQVVKKAVDLYRSNPKERFFTRKLGKEVGMNPNIAESAFHWLLIAVKGKIDKEQKVQGLLNFLLKNPQQLIEWLIFGRSTYTERSLEKYWKLKRRYIINLLTSTRLQTDSYWRKKHRKSYDSNLLQLNALLPKNSQPEVLQALDDVLFYYTHEFSNTSQLTKNQQAFLNKLKFLKQEQTTVVPFLTSWINSPQPSRWKSLKELAEQLAQVLGKPTRKLFSAIRLIVVFTLFDYYMQSVPQLIKVLPVEKVVPLPFKRKKKGRLPIKLLMKKDYVIARQGNAYELTKQVKKQGWTNFSFPKMGKKRLTARVLFPRKVLEYLTNGAQIKVFQVSSEKAPSFKPRVDVVLEGAHDCFHSSTLLHRYLHQIPAKKTSVLGIDINRLGQYMVVFNVPVPLPPDLLDLANHYDHLSKKVIDELNRGYLRKRKEYDTLGSCKLKGELNRVYNRRSRILREITRLLPHFLAAVLVKKQCQTLKIERLATDATGTKGALAKAIYTMPDSLFIYKKAVWLASLELGYEIKLESVHPYYTSTLHYGCNGTLNRNKGQYDVAPCSKCGHQVNTHFNAALNIASLSGTLLHNDFFPSTHMRGTI